MDRLTTEEVLPKWMCTRRNTMEYEGTLQNWRVDHCTVFCLPDDYDYELILHCDNATEGWVLNDFFRQARL